MQKAYKLHLLANLLQIYRISSANLYQGWQNQTWKFQVCSSFIWYMQILYMQILYIPNDCSATGHAPFLVWDGIQATNGEPWPQNCFKRCFTCSVVDFWGFLSIIPSVAHMVRPHPDYWTPSTVSKQKFDYSFPYLLGLEDQFSATKDTICI